MSQEIYSLDTTKEVREIIPKMQKTIEAGLSNLSGTTFPTTNLVVGMQCYRTDLKRIYVLESISPVVWKIIPDDSDATTTNNANKLVKRDASGNFSAGTITANLVGNAKTATTASNANLLDNFDVAANKAVAPSTPVDINKILKTESDGWLRVYRAEAQYFYANSPLEAKAPTKIFASYDNYIRAINPANVKVGALLTPRKISLIGSVTGNVDFDGSGNVSINTTIALNNIFVKQNTAPTNTAVLWINTTDRTLNYHNGSGWVQIVGVYAGT